ncbi:MAG TPA: protein-L-isoaspartate O-methyltransferase, partial [Magnetococcales bacterium]|nr:protein-L-isoaspartate O-methyltransferase [Magnetococcales bacterium]
MNWRRFMAWLLFQAEWTNGSQRWDNSKRFQNNRKPSMNQGASKLEKPPDDQDHTMVLDPPATRPERQEMVSQQLRPRGITDPKVLEAMATIPREFFVPPSLEREAYLDGPIPIGEGQTISQPYMVAIMAQLLQAKDTSTLLEIGAGSGYGAAILSRLATRVIAVERIPRLLEQARHRWHQLGLDNIEGVVGDGTLGHPLQAP